MVTETDFKSVGLLEGPTMTLNVPALTFMVLVFVFHHSKLVRGSGISACTVLPAGIVTR